jgi:hypothetical protein
MATDAEGKVVVIQHANTGVAEEEDILKGNERKGKVWSNPYITWPAGERNPVKVFEPPTVRCRDEISPTKLDAKEQRKAALIRADLLKKHLSVLTAHGPLHQHQAEPELITIRPGKRSKERAFFDD